MVVREIKKAKTDDQKLESSDVFSATTPVENVSGAHFYGVCERDVYVEPFSELHRPGFVGELDKTTYGTQDASKRVAETVG